MRILGIDPGYDILGWSVIEESLTIVDYGIIKTDPAQPIDERLSHIHNDLQSVIRKYHPDCAAVEKLYFAKNTSTVMQVAMSIGAIILTLRMGGVVFYEYTPSQVKLSITGFGRASKEQVQIMIKRIFNISEIPRPDDAADALAIAACHSFNNTKLSGVQGNQRASDSNWVS